MKKAVGRAALRQILGTSIIPLLLASAMLLLSVALGPDASWDLRNYHLYDAYAALRKPPFHDLVPAQLQSFHPPLVDLPSVWLRFRLDRHPDVLDALLGLPSAAAVVLAWHIGRAVVPAATRRDRLALLLAIVLGATGAAGLPTTGTSMSEMPAACLALGGLLLLLRSLDHPPPPWHLVTAGLLFGAAVALKLTVAILALAGVAAFATCSTARPARRLGETSLAAAGMAIGLLLVGGPWWAHLARLTGNPLFPYFNGLFRSPLLPPTSIDDTRFLPRTLAQAVSEPFLWGFTPSRVASELTVRDPRLPVALLAGFCCALPVSARTGLSRPAAALLVFCATDAVLWEDRFGILRYLAPIELLSGLPVLLALRRLSPRCALPALAGVLLLCASFTIYPDWGRARPADRAAGVSLPPLPPDAMVLLLSGDPMAYVAAFTSPRIRFVGIDNNLIHPGDRFPLARLIEGAVRSQAGPIYGLEVPDPAGPADAALRYYGLHRILPCRPVVTNLEQDGLRLCPLAR